MVATTPFASAGPPFPARRRPTSAGDEISAVRAALRAGQYREVINRCETALAQYALRAEQEVALRCLLAEAKESLALFTEAVQVLEKYCTTPAREALAPEEQTQVCLRLASAYGGTPEIPTAFSYARQALALANRQSDAAAVGEGHLLLGTLYRRLGETRFAREHFLHARTQALRFGDDLLLAKAYNGLGLVSVTESDWDGARTAFDKGRELLTDADAPLLDGSLDINLAAVVALQGRWRESVVLLERAIIRLERTQHPRLIVNARSNLGYSLMRLGEMGRAREVLEHALAEARGCEALLVAASTFETLGEWHCLRGEYDSASTSRKRD